MLRLPRFTYVGARSAAEAVDVLARHAGDALPVSGGTDLYANMKQRLFEPKIVVGLRAIPGLNRIDYDDERGLVVGALTTLSDLAASEVVLRRYPALAQAALSISTPPLRNAGTIGGNICVDTRCNYYNQNLDWRKALGYCMKKDGDVCRVAPKSPRCVAVNSSDTAPVLLAFDARLTLVGPGGERELALADFYRDDGMYAWAKKPDEIVTSVTLPPPPVGTRSAYLKLRLRNSFDFPILGVAAVARMAHGRCSTARLVLNAVAPKPIEVRAAARALIGSTFDEAARDAAAEAAFDAGKPLDNTSATIPYRKRMLRVFARRALDALVAEPSEN